MAAKETKLSIEVTFLFPIGEREVVYAHLRSFDWDLTLGIEAYLCQERTCLPVRQVGRMNINGQAVMVLSPACEWASAVAIVDEMRAKADRPVYLQREA
jgi:hypothetical protein